MVQWGKERRAEKTIAHLEGHVPGRPAETAINGTSEAQCGVHRADSMSLTVKSLKELWAKEIFPNIREEIRKEVDSLNAGLQDLRKRFEEIEKSQDFISKKCDTVILTIMDVKEHKGSLKGDVRVIKEDIGKLGNDYLNVEIQLDELEQYARRD
ncbi:hypothetical protein AWC38_SpisGene17219 [Stylophora pistillata]|uniref:Uncharacterized protein n=1 Tax=Stylophora pistillata TaxID=50429 RepID=A0A2B4RQ74_STYPI|nr:hypothetical protein AWC38_SpisGene17219 [Stylophora pistillata]